MFNVTSVKAQETTDEEYNEVVSKDIVSQKKLLMVDTIVYFARIPVLGNVQYRK